MKINYDNKWALVTGASKGLGFCYVEELLKKNMNVICTARDTSSVEILKEKYKNREIVCLNYDLSDIENCYKLFEDCKKHDISLLINNAGYGVWGLFAENDLENELNMIDLNIKALHILSKLFINYFISKNEGRIINISSLASFVPGPGFASYYASKAYVLNLSVGVNIELKKQKTKVRMISICPGVLKTNFWGRSTNQENAEYHLKFKVMKTNVYARKSLSKALKTKKDFVIVGTANKLTKWASLNMPRKAVLDYIYKYQVTRK